jgi:LmbE family N-acetylglucosaminyl deacetylase
MSRLLFIGAHPDDIELGASGFVSTALKKKHEVEWVVLSKANDQPGNQNILSELEQSCKVLGIEKAEVLEFPTLHFPRHRTGIRQSLEKIRDAFNPDLVVTHSINDIMQDHYVAYRETERVFRNTSIISYEIPRSTIRFKPNLYIPLDADALLKKLDALECYGSQRERWKRQAVDINSIVAQATFRGLEIGKRYAEAFEVVRLTWLI